MERNVDLLEGPIAISMAKLAFPIMGTSLIQMAYNMTDMIWIGRISSNAVAAVGAAGMYLWLANGVAVVPRMGAQVKVGHSLGAGNAAEAREYIRGAIQLGIVMGILYGLICIFCNMPLVSFFKLNSPQVIEDARWYLLITGGGVLFSFLNQIITGILTAMGNSMVTFRATTIGLAINIILDPVLIFGVGFIPKMGVIGAAIATVFAQVVVCLIYFLVIWREPVVFCHLNLRKKTSGIYVQEMIAIGGPVAIQSMLFTGISMVIARLVATWGDAAVAVQKVGSQIESISWMTAEGFGTAVNAFVAQNFGAEKIRRIQKGYATALVIMMVWGVITSLVLIVCPEVIFRVFIREADVIPMGVDYLRILGVSQLFMCTELTAAGAFQGVGRTMPPSVTGIVLTTLRIPMAMALSHTLLGLNGIWWSISISSILKGLVLPFWFFHVFSKYTQRITAK